MKSKKVQGIVMASVGGIIVLVSALALIFNWDFFHPVMAVIGIVFLGAGLAIARKS